MASGDLGTTLEALSVDSDAAGPSLKFSNGAQYRCADMLKCCKEDHYRPVVERGSMTHYVHGEEVLWLAPLGQGSMEAVPGITDAAPAACPFFMLKTVDGGGPLIIGERRAFFRCGHDRVECNARREKKAVGDRAPYCSEPHKN